MEEMSLNGTLQHEIVLEKICAQSKKDASGRRKSFRVTMQDIHSAVRERINCNIDKLFETPSNYKPLIPYDYRRKRITKRLKRSKQENDIQMN